jgi:hypothetical protein
MDPFRLHVEMKFWRMYLLYVLVVVAFKEYIHKLKEVYLDDWTIYILLKDHDLELKLMLDRSQQM